MDREERLRVLADLVAETRQEVERSDNKAAILFAALSITAGALGAATIQTAWSPSRLGNDVEWLFWLGAGAAFLGLALAAVSLYPRMVRQRARPEVPLFFGDVGSYDSLEQFREALLDSEFDSALRATELIWVVGQIVVRKYRYIRASLVASVVGISFCLTAIFTNGLLHLGQQ